MSTDIRTAQMCVRVYNEEHTESNVYFAHELISYERTFAQNEYEIYIMRHGSHLLSRIGVYVHGSTDGPLQSEYITVSNRWTVIPYNLAIALAEFIYKGYKFQLWDQLTDAAGYVLEWRLSYRKED